MPPAHMCAPSIYVLSAYTPCADVNPDRAAGRPNTCSNLHFRPSPTWSARGREGARALLALALAERFAELLQAGFDGAEAHAEPLTDGQKTAVLTAARELIRERVTRQSY
jgi:hypothetical protein